MRSSLFSIQNGASAATFGRCCEDGKAMDTAFWRAHSTPDPDAVPHDPTPNPNPDDVPPPANVPVQEPRQPEPPIKA